jgi:hypothetical protein
MLRAQLAQRCQDVACGFGTDHAVVDHHEFVRASRKQAELTPRIDVEAQAIAVPLGRTATDDGWGVRPRRETPGASECLTEEGSLLSQLRARFEMHPVATATCVRDRAGGHDPFRRRIDQLPGERA